MNPKPILLLILLLAMKPALSQDSIPRMYEADTLRRAFGLRGKVLPGYGIEDWHLLNATLGAEFRFARHHSLGIDYVFLRQRFEKDLYDTIKNEELTYGYSKYIHRQFLMVDYRFYIYPEYAAFASSSIYLSLSAAVGNARTWNQQGYHFAPDDIVHHHEKFYDIGLSVGIHFSISESGRTGIDFSLGCLRRDRVRNIEYYTDGGPNRIVNNEKAVDWMPSIRLRVYHYLCRK